MSAMGTARGLPEPRVLETQPLSAAAFAPFGDVIEAVGEPDRLINRGQCGRFHDLARLDVVDGRPGISLFQSAVFRLPHTLDLLERHPLGSQAFLPLDPSPFLVVVAPDEGGKPGRPLAFLTQPGQGINLFRGTWHGVLTPLGGRGLFAVIDRIGAGANLEEHTLPEAWTITEGPSP